jgi:perosamine synthetase
MCAHLEPAYRQHQPWTCGSGPAACACPDTGCLRLQMSERAQAETIILPLFHDLTADQQATVADALRAACGQVASGAKAA